MQFAVSLGIRFSASWLPIHRTRRRGCFGFNADGAEHRSAVCRGHLI